MAPKKPNQQKKAPKVIPHKDNYARVTYLYQAANLFSASPKYEVLSRGLARTLDLVSKKTVLKLSPELKRTLCKKCNSVLIPGLSVSIYIENLSKSKAPHNDSLIHKCLKCHEIKRFPVGKNRAYVVFAERDDVRSDAK
ncbi:RNAse P Rpr2/Rpp21/SNM1 subunit domain-containing protein [Scheffersomyces xylosifermentans]|uniref:RNAse P Rpr2/Rpp21/SNM1 subunit domain-containing protein n=1 Tax=Scheffersomyces xylosifermentans TaxID=1304137 RepID=UPI00315D8DB3